MSQQPQYEHVRASTRADDESVKGYTRRRAERPGRTPTIPETLLARMLDMRVDGMSYSQIGAALEAQGELTPAGGTTWTVSSVKSALGQYALELVVRERREARAAGG